MTEIFKRMVVGYNHVVSNYSTCILCATALYSDLLMYVHLTVFLR